MAVAKKQISHFPDGRIRFRSSFRDQPFAVIIDPANKELSWSPEVEFTPPPEAPKPKGEKKSGCGGCTGKLLKKLAKGSIGLGKAMLKLDRADVELAAERQDICENRCTANCYDFGICRDDPPYTGCGCILALKVLTKKEECPHGLW